MAKRLLLRHYESAIYKKYHNFFQGPSNPGFRSVKVQTETFLKKDSQDFKNSFQFRFLWIPSKPGEQNQKVLILWWFIIVERQCEVESLMKVFLWYYILYFVASRTWRNSWRNKPKFVYVSVFWKVCHHFFTRLCRA